MTVRGGERGFATTELVLGVGLLLLPAVLLVTLLPGWSEVRLAAASSADAAATAAALAVATGGPADDHAEAAARAVLDTHRVEGAVVVDVAPSRVTVDVTVPLPTIPLIGVTVGGLTTTARSVRLVDPYRAPSG